MAVETLTYTYTSQDEIERFLSQDGVDARTDDLANADDWWDDLIAMATDKVNFYCERWYDPEDMASNRWIRNHATVLGAFYLSLRRADPGIYHDLYQLYVAELEEVHSGRMQVPRLPQRGDLVPSMSNLEIDERYPHRKIRVDPTTSVGQSSGRQFPARRYHTEPY